MDSELVTDISTVIADEPENPKRSAFDVTGIDLDISTKEIVEFVREGREKL